MPKQGTRAEINSFIKGLITEAGPLTFPANAASDIKNFVLYRDGTIARRLGMDFEAAYALHDTSTSPTAMRTAGTGSYKWTSVGGDNQLDFLVVQINHKLWFFDVSESSLSGAGYISTVDITDFPNDTDYSFASIQGNLVVAAGAQAVAIVTYDGAGMFAVSYARLRVRDQWGVAVDASDYETDKFYRDNTLPDEHLYNLQNQSWGITRKDKAGNYDDPVDVYFDEHQVYPSNSEVVWTGLQYQATTGGADPYERMFPNLYQDIFGADVNAPKGYYVIDLLSRGSSRVDEFEANYEKSNTYNAGTMDFTHKLSTASVTLPADLTTGGAAIVTEFAGRVFYAGFGGEVTAGDSRSPYLSNYIAFSQLVASSTEINKCYQEGDPTSRENSDVVDTDGGLMRISGANTIIGLKNMNTYLVVIATNGVWAIEGGSDFGFSATNYKVRKLSDFGGISRKSIVDDGAQCYYWAEDGIYQITRNNLGDLVVNNLTQITIQSFYDELDLSTKRNAVGVYDLYNKVIRWIYKDGVMFSETSSTRELVLDTVLNAFYPNVIGNLDSADVEIISFSNAALFKYSDVQDVIADSDYVYANDDLVIIGGTIRNSGVIPVRYVTVTSDGATTYLTFSLYNNEDFLDWESQDSIGIDADAYFDTGSQTAGDSAIHKQIPYLIMHFYRTEDQFDEGGAPLNPSSCKVRSKWDWSNSGNSHKWSSLFQAYRLHRHLRDVVVIDEYDDGFETVITKSKLRGRGRAFSLHAQTEPGKDCQILGWSLTINGNANA